MAKVYINIHSGPELKNKATLGLLVAVTAQKNGHEVKVFFAADGVHLKETNTKIYVSGMSAKARSYDENILKEYNAEFAMPDILIELSLDADSFLSF